MVPNVKIPMESSWHLDVHFSLNFVTPRNLFISYHFVPLVWYRKSTFVHVLTGNVLGHSFFILSIDFVWNCFILAPLRNLAGPKRSPNFLHYWHRNGSKGHQKYRSFGSILAGRGLDLPGPLRVPRGFMFDGFGFHFLVGAFFPTSSVGVCKLTV